MYFLKYIHISLTYDMPAIVFTIENSTKLYNTEQGFVRVRMKWLTSK